MAIAAASATTAHAQVESNRTKQLYRLRVQTAIVSPIKNARHYWDGPLTASPGAAQKTNALTMALNMRKAVRLAKQLAATGGNPMAVATILTSRAGLSIARLILSTVEPPDPAGRLLIDGTPVLGLPMQKNTATPSWANARSVPVTLGPRQVITLELWDADLSDNDPIGTCSWRNVGMGRRTRALVADRCDAPKLMGAVLIAEPAGTASAAKLTPGDYKITQVAVEAAATKASGRTWDASQGAPDLLVEVLVDGKVVHTCRRVKNQHSAVCNPGTTIHISENTKLSVKVTDLDAMFHDHVGLAQAGHLLRQRQYRAIRMRTTGQLQSATITLAPVRRSARRPNMVAVDARAQLAESQRLANQACACTWINCARSVMNRVKRFVAKTRQQGVAKGNLTKLRTATTRTVRCLVKQGIPRAEVVEALRRAGSTSGRAPAAGLRR